MIYNCDCIEGSKKHILDECIDLIICDPPFGIKESKLKSVYNRKSDKIIKGYMEAPKNYYKFTTDWMTEAKRILKKDGSMYIISGWTYSDIIGRVIRELNLCLINKIIWNFPFGIYTKKKYVTIHYEIFYLKKRKSSKPIFNTDCRYQGGKKIYQDLQSVWKINKENQPGKVKNINKLPEELVNKMIQYSSDRGDVVCDFFLGNFTTAISSKKLDRLAVGFEMNEESFNIGLSKLGKTTKTEDIFENI